MHQHVSGYGRIIAVLDEVIASRGAAGVRQLSESTGVARSTAGRILQSLTGADLLEATGTGDYQEGPRLQILMGALRRDHPLVNAVRERADELAHRVSSTVVLSMFEPACGRAFIAFTQRHPGPVEYALDAGTFVPLHAGSVGQAIAMSTPTQVLEAKNLEAFTTETIIRPNELEERLSKSRKRGYVVSAGQHIELAAGVAAPFRAYGLAGSVSVSGPKYSSTMDDLHKAGVSLLQVARDIETVATEHGAALREPVVGVPRGATAAARFLRLISIVIAALPDGVQPGPRLAVGIGANAATVRNLVQELLDYGVLTRSGNMITAGPLLFLWSARVNPVRGVVEYAEPFLRALSAETGETIALSEYDASTERAVAVRVLRGPGSMSYGLSAGGGVPLHAGALGKAILANCPHDVLDRIYLERYTARTICTRAELRDELDDICSQGYSTGDGERMPDAFGIGAAILQDGVPIGSIAITIARARRHSLDIRSLGAKVQAAARTLSELLSVETPA